MNRNIEQIKEKIEALKAEAEQKGVSLELSEEEIYENRQHCLWYGGNIATAEYKGIEVYIEANGDIYADLYDKNGEYITHTKDKGNNGNFFHDMRDYIKNDEELIECLGLNDLDSEKEPRLRVTDNNWIEYSLYDTKKEIWVDLGLDGGIVDETDDVLDAVDISYIVTLVDEYLAEEN